MSESYDVSLRSRGRLTIPAAVREERGLVKGAKLILVEVNDHPDPAQNGLWFYTADDLLELAQAEGIDPGFDALAVLDRHRRAMAVRENAEMDAAVAEAEDETATEGSPPSEAERDK